MRTSLALAPCLLALLVAAGCRGEDSRVSPAEAAELLTDRNWLDVWPTSTDQKLHVYRFTPSMGGGVFQDRTLFAGHFELFTFEIRGDELAISWPHRDIEEVIPFEIRRVDGPRPFDLRLELRGNSTGPSVFYGRRAETGDGFGLGELNRSRR